MHSLTHNPMSRLSSTGHYSPAAYHQPLGPHAQLRPSPLAFGMSLFGGNARSEASRWGVLAGCTVNPAAASRSSLSLTRCPSVWQPQSTMQTEMHGMRQKRDHVDDVERDGGRAMSIFEAGGRRMVM